MAYDSLFTRLVANSQVPEGQSEDTGCWVWTGNTDHKGYGRVTVRRPGAGHTKVRAHRAMMEIVLGRPLHPDDETVEHLCYCTGCINPDHLTTLSRSENSKAMQARRRALASATV